MSSDANTSRSTTGSAVIQDALRELRDTLTADGYDLEWAVEPENRLVVRVVAGADACAECLVPRQVMEAIMSDALSSTPYELDRLELPASP
jgi:hypothetical protein